MTDTKPRPLPTGRRPAHPEALLRRALVDLASGVDRRRAAAIGAAAVGAAAAGALAFGALAIGSAAIGALAVGRARVGKLSIGTLEVGRIRIRPAAPGRDGSR